MNIEILKQAKAYILAHPEQIDMDLWLNTKTFKAPPLPSKLVKMEEFPCGTTGCIAGIVCFLAKDKGKSEYYSSRAEEILELPNDSTSLFFVSSWPEEFAILHLPKDFETHKNYGPDFKPSKAVLLDEYMLRLREKGELVKYSQIVAARIDYLLEYGK